MAAVLSSTIMAQNNNTNASDDVKPTVLHDFLGRGYAPVTKFASASDGAGGSSPSASVSGERQGGTHFEGVPFFGPKNDLPGAKIRYSGSKRSNSDSAFMAPSIEGIPQSRPDFPETSHLMKMLRNVGAERSRWPHEDESSMGVHQIRPTLSSLMVQPATGLKIDANEAKWDRAIPVNLGPVLQYPQEVSNRFKDTNVGSSTISQSAADEGSRTGIKGSGILSPVNISGGVLNQAAANKRFRSTSASRQMTIFYGGQAHVFDDVPPNKADVIMALAGSNGGSWSTSFLPNSAFKPSVGEASPGGQGNVITKDPRGPMQAVAEQKSEDNQC